MPTLIRHETLSGFVNIDRWWDGGRYIVITTGNAGDEVYLADWMGKNLNQDENVTIRIEVWK